MSLMVVKPVMIGLILAASHPSLPTIDFKRTCMDLSAADGARRCIDEELYARRKLLKYWSRMPDSYKRQCISDPMPPYPSYTILRNCINNNVILRGVRAR